jgi:hypothetical protein
MSWSAHVIDEFSSREDLRANSSDLLLGRLEFLGILPPLLAHDLGDAHPSKPAFLSRHLVRILLIVAPFLFFLFLFLLLVRDLGQGLLLAWRQSDSSGSSNHLNFSGGKLDGQTSDFN